MNNSKSKENLPTYKIIVVGETNVGKTCIIKRYIHNKYTDYNRNTIMKEKFTKIISVNKKKIQLEIWDTVGSEKYRSVTKMFYRNASVVILVYDITNEQTFNELKNYWYNEIINNLESNISKIYI